MSEYKDFSSMPPEEERQFAIYEERSQVAAAQAKKQGIAGAAAVGVLMLLFSAFTWGWGDDAIPDDESPAPSEAQDELGAE